MGKKALKKEKWTLSFDSDLKKMIIREAKKRKVYPVNLLETIVREQFNPYGYTDVKNSIQYLRKIRKNSITQADEDFLQEIREWQNTKSS